MDMRAAILHEQGLSRPYVISQPLQVELIGLDGPRDGEVLVEIRAAGLCHSDLSTIEGIRPRPIPLVPGHEASGIIREVGPGVEGLRVDDHVVMVFVTSCGQCPECVGGRSNLCGSSVTAKAKGELIAGGRRFNKKGGILNHASGISCFAEYAVVDQRSAFKISDDIPLDDAAVFGCAVITGVGAVLTMRTPVDAPPQKYYTHTQLGPVHVRVPSPPTSISARHLLTSLQTFAAWAPVPPAERIVEKAALPASRGVPPASWVAMPAMRPD